MVRTIDSWSTSAFRFSVPGTLYTTTRLPSLVLELHLRAAETGHGDAHSKSQPLRRVNPRRFSNKQGMNSMQSISSPRGPQVVDAHHPHTRAVYKSFTPGAHCNLIVKNSSGKPELAWKDGSTFAGPNLFADLSNRTTIVPWGKRDGARKRDGAHAAAHSSTIHSAKRASTGRAVDQPAQVCSPLPRRRRARGQAAERVSPRGAAHRYAGFGVGQKGRRGACQTPAQSGGQGGASVRVRRGSGGSAGELWGAHTGGATV